MPRHLVITALALASLALAAAPTGAQARTHHTHHAHARHSGPAAASYRHRHRWASRRSGHHRKRAYGLARGEGGEARIVGGRPSGCPYEFCACGIRKFLGLADPALNLAANWPRKFQRAQPAPYTVAARPGHAFLLLSPISGNVWLVHDWNSGRHMTRVHPRSIVGFAIVDPKAPRARGG